MITLTDHATEAIRALCAAAGRSTATVRVHAVHTGTPVPVEITTEQTDHKPGDLVLSSHGVVVLIDRELAAPFDHHALTADPDEEGTPRIHLEAPTG